VRARASPAPPCGRFYSTTERAEIAELLQSLIAGQEPDTSAPADEPDAANAAGSSPVDPAAEATPAVAEAPPPAAPTSDPAAGEAATASNNVAAFFSMMQGQTQAQLPGGGAAAPPTPTGATDAHQSTTRAATFHAGAAHASTALGEASAEAAEGDGSPLGGVTLASLKAELRGKLQALLDDDAFLETLAREYLSQGAGADGASGGTSSGGTGAPRSQRGKAQQTPATRPAAAEVSSSEIPAHLMALLQQQQL
jgi:hypothetical protein